MADIFDEVEAPPKDVFDEIADISIPQESIPRDSLERAARDYYSLPPSARFTAPPVKGMAEPFVPLPRAESDSPAFRALLTGFTGQSPTDETAAKAAAVLNTLKGFAEFGESPAGGLTAIAGGAGGPLVQKLIGLGFAGQMASQVPEAARQAGAASVTGTPQEKAEAALALGANIGLPALLGAGVAKKGPNAPQERIVQESVQPERAGTEAQRLSPETSPGDSLQPETPVQAKADVAAPSETGLQPAIEVTPDAPPITGPAGQTHAEVLQEHGIPPESIPHEDPRRGFIEQANPDELVTRKEAEKQTGIEGTAKAGGLDSQDLPEAKQPIPKGLATAPPAELQMTVLPGAKEFIEQDLTPKLEESAKVIGETAKHIQATLSPPSMSESAQLAAGIAREAKAELARKDVQFRMQFDQARKSMDKLSKPEALAFTDAIERGTKQPTKAAQDLSDSLRAEFDKRVQQVRDLGTGKLQEVRENYFPHIWKDPEAAVSWYARILGKRPLRGPGAFLKRRTIDFTTDGVAAGLEPVTWNPIELAALKAHEMDRYVMGQKIFNEFKEKGLAQFSRSDIPPEGMAKIDDRIANVVEYRPTTKADGSPGAPERVIRGHWYAQEDAARVLNNFLSPGLERYAWYRSLRWVGNTMNLAQLGISGYHFTFTMIDSSTGKLALGLEQVSQGKFGKGLMNIARGEAGLVGVNQLEYFLKGSKVLKEYTKPGSVGGDYAKIVDSLLAAGGRVEMPQIFKNSSLENFTKALRSGNYPGAILRAPFAAIQAVSHPLMQVIVPKLKLGAFTDMARYELEKLKPDATRDDVRKVMGKVWDSVDNRMGEMVYDNLFWKRILKDLSFLAVRAVGWNLGTIRELGGGVLDSARIIQRLRAGEPAVTRRMAYVVALPITVGTMGAMYQYAKTGKGPQDLRDYFYPKTGKILPDGTEERVDFPSYLKDIYSYTTHPLRTIINKLHPLWSDMHKMITNRDYYGTQIRNPDDPIVKQVGQELEFIGRTFVPFSVKGAERRVGAKESPEIKAESFFGVMPIPAEIARTPAQNKIMEYGIAKMPQGARTQDEQQRMELKRDLESQLQSPEDYSKAQTKLKELQRQGKMTRGQQIYENNKLRFQQNQILNGRTKSEAQWLWRFKHLSLNEARQVYNLATPAEKKLFDRDLQLKERKSSE